MTELEKHTEQIKVLEIVLAGAVKKGDDLQFQIAELESGVSILTQDVQRLKRTRPQPPA